MAQNYNDKLAKNTYTDVSVINWEYIFVSPELSSVRDYVITHSVRSMYVVCSMYVCVCMWYFTKLITVSTYIDVLSWDLDTMILG